MRFKKGKSRTIDKRTVYEEIEGLQTELLKREKDYQLVVEGRNSFLRCSNCIILLLFLKTNVNIRCSRKDVAGKE